MELAPFPLDAGWLPGFHRASPSTPLDAYSYVVGSVAKPDLDAIESQTRLMPATDDPLSPPCRACPSPFGRRARVARSLTRAA